MSTELKEFNFTILEMENGLTRLVIVENEKVVEIFEGELREVLNCQLNFLREKGFTEEKFRIRK